MAASAQQQGNPAAGEAEGNALGHADGDDDGMRVGDFVGAALGLDVGDDDGTTAKTSLGFMLCAKPDSGKILDAYRKPQTRTHAVTANIPDYYYEEDDFY